MAKPKFPGIPKRCPVCKGPLLKTTDRRLVEVDNPEDLSEGELAEYMTASDCDVDNGSGFMETVTMLSCRTHGMVCEMTDEYVSLRDFTSRLEKSAAQEPSKSEVKKADTRQRSKASVKEHRCGAWLTLDLSLRAECGARADHHYYRREQRGRGGDYVSDRRVCAQLLGVSLRKL